MTRKLKIIIFDGSFKTRSFINRLAKGLAEKHEVYILGFNEDLPNKLKNVHYVPLGSNQSKLRLVMTSLFYAIQSGSINCFISTLSKLASGRRKQLQKQNLQFVLNKIAPDIIHLQWVSVIPWFEEELKKQKYPIVMSQLGFHINVRPFVNNKNYNYLKSWYPKMAGFHSVSKAISNTGDKIWNTPSKIDKVVYTGLFLKEIPFSQEYKVSKPLQLLSIGRAHWIKGYDYAIKTCAILKENSIPFQYTIIGGEGDEELQFLIADHGLKDCVQLKSQVSQNEVFSMMRGSSILLMPSLDEGIPNVVVEAMAIGLPVISTDCGGVSELISNGLDGWIVPIRNPKAMADAIFNFFDFPYAEIENIRLAARKKVEQQHNEKQMISGMEELYCDVLSLRHDNKLESKIADKA